MLSSQSNLPIDDNLRLIFSKDHKEWLERQILDARNMIIGSLLLTSVLCVGLIGVVHYTGFFEHAEACIVVPEGRTLTGLQADGLISQGMVECAADSADATPADMQSGWLPKDIGIAWLLGLVFVLIMIPATIVDVFRNAFKLHEYKRYAEEHDEFLRKYNRL